MNRRTSTGLFGPSALGISALLPLFLAAGGCTKDGDDGPPIASLSAPDACGQGEIVVVDASGSSASGAVVEQTFIFGDGTPALRTIEARVSHRYMSSGSFQIVVHIVDDKGRSARGSARIVISLDGPDGPCEPPIGGPPDRDAGTAECQPGTTQRCGNDVGRCQAGSQTCGGEGEWGECRGGVGPVNEVCGNGTDDDCDGRADEGCDPCNDGSTRPCGSNQGECLQGRQACVDGDWSRCEGSRGPTPEVCNGLDDDCDGQADEALGCVCDEGGVRRCGSSTGECRAGVETCRGNRWSACEGAVGASDERCNGVDDDCDGVTDEGCECDEGEFRRCGSDVGACRSGVQLCEQGAWGTCIGARPATREECDGRDNDCDGFIDEGCECEEGDRRRCGSEVGECRSGAQDCRRGEWQGCVGAIVPSAEECDGLDNDCNGIIDDLCPCRPRQSRACGIGTGVCEPGRQDCVRGQWGQCIGAVLPAPEECDNRDNDCDGRRDESLLRRCSTACGNGFQVCSAGAWNECSSGAPQPETCDGRDEDCDGQIDEGVTRPCRNQCGPGEEICFFGRFVACDAPDPAPEECNGADDDCDGQIDEGLSLPACPLQLGVCSRSITPCLGDGGLGDCAAEGAYGNSYQRREVRCDARDNDCDGSTDEGCACEPGQQTGCGSTVGACEAGVQRCRNNGQWGLCEGLVGPVPETCNGADDNCDGRVDEAISRVCRTACGEGIRLCEDGAFGDCSSPEPRPEECNGVDDDCDGQVDEDCGCAPGETRFCGSDVGECRAGFQVCLGDGFGPCIGETGPGPEGCDGLDNDCDGDVDEDCRCRPGTRQACGTDVGECVSGEQRCGDDALWGACEGAVPSAEEECDGVDNDCDGLIDEFCPCEQGQRRQCGSDVGECRPGIQICIIGRWGPCFGASNPAPEQCDGLDNDCDGEADEICECRQGEIRVCGTDIGQCQRGRQGCLDDGFFGQCEGAVDPGPELCNGLDDDCDGQIDNGCACRDGEAQPCGSDVGACVPGVEVCAGGVFGPCEGAVGPTPEACDGIDNDCDGALDNGIPCVCVPGQRRHCGSGVGECERGQQICGGDGWLPCEGGTGPAPEVCDNADNDCDGAIDEGGVCQVECEPGELRDCGSDVGECRSGVEACADGQFGPCEGAVGPSIEECNGLDDDCDGELDEGCECGLGEQRACGEEVGACEPGTQDCVDGAWGACVGDTGPAPEACGDGIDNDCDGDVDEECADCQPGATRACGSDIGACQRGLETCGDDGSFGPCEGEVGPTAEDCNAEDDDCDGQIDEGCACIHGQPEVCGSDVGRCLTGTAECVFGELQACIGGRGPIDEECNSEDDDCDGDVDEDCACVGGTTRPCGTEVGECRAGSQLCFFGEWGGCNGGVEPAPEACDGLDNDCDSTIDNGCGCRDGMQRTCGTDIGQCTAGIQRCVDGGWQACEGAVEGTPDVCGDGLDNDCDGNVDEGCICEPGQFRPCGSDEGTCQAGLQICRGRSWDDCIGGVPPAFEICDGLDNDCDGQVDDGCECEQGEFRVCGSDVGTCRVGRERCINGSYGECENATGPEAEVCDGEDNDCDGQTDEGCPCQFGEQRSCGSDVGACQTGIQICGFGFWGPCLGGVRPAGEVCDGLDNDCDGEADEAGDDGPLTCGEGDGDCEHVDGYVQVDDSTCAYRRHQPGVRQCDPRGICPLPECVEFEDEFVEQCGDCTTMQGCDGAHEPFCAPLDRGQECGIGGACDGAGTCVEPGCADGEREGFTDMALFPEIASCAGSFAAQSLRNGPTGQPCGDDLGECGSPADLCGEGWRLCMRSGNPDDLADRVSDQLCDSDVAGEGVYVAAASHCSVRNGCGYNVPLPCWRRGYCSEAVCCGSGCGFGGCRDGVFHDRTGIAPGIENGCGRAGGNVDGVLCCRD